MPKFAPANDQGEKPYVATVYQWGKYNDELTWADDAAQARSKYTRLGTGEYLERLRRATPDDLDTLST